MALSLPPIRSHGSPGRLILRAAAAVTGAGLLVKLAATGKEIAVAGVFARSDAMDAFVVASLIPGLLVNLISESMNQALIPTLVRVREREGVEPAQQLLSNSMLWLCLLLAAASLVMAVGARSFFPLIAWRFAVPKLDLAVRLFYLLLPVVLFTGIASNCTAVLNTLDRFTLPALAPAVTPLAIIAAALLCGTRWGIWVLADATLAGALAQAVLMAWMMDSHGYHFRLRWYAASEASREVAHQYGSVMLSSVVASGGLLADQAMAAMLSAGSVSALAYASRFVSVVLTLLAGTISTALAPYFARLIAHRDWQGCRQTLHTWVRITALLSLPISAALIAAARPLIRLLLQHGTFTALDTAAVAPVLALYAIQIPFFAVSRVFYRFLVALRRTDLVLYCGVLNLVLDIVLNLVLMRCFSVAGIALATSLWTIATCFLLGYWTVKLLPKPAML